MDEKRKNSLWIHCPNCGGKTRTKVYEDNLLGHSKEIISADVYGDTQEIIEDCLYAIEPFIEDVIKETRCEKYFDYSDMNEVFGRGIYRNSMK